MTNLQSFIIATLTALIPVLIPAIVTLIFTAQKQKLEILKKQSENYKETIADAIKTAQALFKEGDGDKKYNWVLDKVSKKIHLPEDELQQLIESVLAETKNAFKENWDKLGK